MYRTGLGWDLHRLQEGNGIRLGGVDIPCPWSFVAHSDGDVLLHALTDALAGGAGLPDIGELFPNTDPANRGRNSREMLLAVLAAVRQKGWVLVALDAVVVADEPRISPVKSAIRAALADLLELEEDDVGLKGKTREGLQRPEERSVEATVVVMLRRRREEEHHG